MAAVAKSYMRKGFLIYEEMSKYLVIYEDAVLSYMTFQPLPSVFPSIPLLSLLCGDKKSPSLGGSAYMGFHNTSS